MYEVPNVRGLSRAAITTTEAGESVVESPAAFIAGTVDPLAQELEAAYRAFEREREYEAELQRAGGVPVYYKVAIAVLVVLLVVITALWLGVI